jgi:putative IMPACT (imprinted ancient) family translation regulator
MDYVPKPAAQSPPWYRGEMAHQTVATRTHHIELIKGSRFHALVFPVNDLEGLEVERERLRELEPDAQHFTFALRCGPLVRFSDDGEPGGTAGRPMLEVLVKRDLTYVGAVVARVFGGVKLGTGGLARAYGGSVAKALDAAGVHTVLDLQRFVLRVPFAAGDSTLRLLAPLVEELEPPQFSDKGMLLQGLVRLDRAELMQREITSVTRGRAQLTLVDAAPLGSRL